MSIHSFDDKGRPSVERDRLERRVVELERENAQLRRLPAALQRQTATTESEGEVVLPWH